MTVRRTLLDASDFLFPKFFHSYSCEKVREEGVNMFPYLKDPLDHAVTFFEELQIPVSIFF